MERRLHSSRAINFVKGAIAMRTFVLALTIVLGLSSAAFSRQYAVQQQGRQRVVHTRILPVVIHRVFPPYTGIHIHESQLNRR
jgi:hypothetical protein